MPPVNENDLQDIKKLGFSISGSESEFLDFLGQHLPDLRLAALVATINNYLAPMTSARLIKELHFFEKELPMLMLQYYRRMKQTKRPAWVFPGLLSGMLQNWSWITIFSVCPKRNGGKERAKRSSLSAWNII